MAHRAEESFALKVCDRSGESRALGKALLQAYVEPDRTGIARYTSAHILRHTYITQLFGSGKSDLKEIRYLAGHSTRDMALRVYTHYDRQTHEGKTAVKVRETLRDQQSPS